MKRKAQSALEYMMTYGWAILVIVIVAAVLYSMGIFSPASSTGTTATGFNPFTVAAQVCTAHGMAISFILGGLQGGATSASVASVTVNSVSGAGGSTGTPTLTETLPLSVTSGTAFTVNMTSVTCSTSGIHYSIGLSLGYSYSAGSLGTITGTATGTVSGSSS